ncbi:MAG: MATE family efflux transporter [Oscillospiraceae bacterium]|nr:MATE family efflux transporter [Oscillospiraceae bacterium]
MFSNKDLRKLIIPLFIEQLLVMLVGMADTFIVSYAGESAVSGVSLVNSFNTVIIYLFTALASGGAVIISQYIGSSNTHNARKSAGQLLMISTVISIIISAIILVLNRSLLKLLFGKVEADVMDACITYLRISAFSFPMLSIYNSGAALCRSIGKTKITMYISTAANIINIIGNLIGVFVLHAGVAGVAYPTLIARTFSAIAITVYCFVHSQDIKYTVCSIFTWDSDLLKRILHIAIPNGVENGIHQLVKVALSSLTALFGTYQIAANGVAQSIWSFAGMTGLAMAPVFTTVIGQCMGAQDINAANYYFKKLSKISFALSVGWNGIILALTPLFIRYFSLSAETRDLVVFLVLLNNIFNGLFYPFAGPFGNGLRAAGDVRFSMFVTVFLTVFGRLLFSYIFMIICDLGVVGIPLGIGLDLLIRGSIFIIRYKSQKWTKFKLI